MILIQRAALLATFVFAGAAFAQETPNWQPLEDVSELTLLLSQEGPSFEIAVAGTTCTRTGSFTHCSGSSGTTTCSRMGSFTHCN